MSLCWLSHTNCNDTLIVKIGRLVKVMRRFGCVILSVTAPLFIPISVYQIFLTRKSLSMNWIYNILCDRICSCGERSRLSLGSVGSPPAFESLRRESFILVVRGGLVVVHFPTIGELWCIPCVTFAEASSHVVSCRMENILSVRFALLGLVCPRSLDELWVRKWKIDEVDRTNLAVTGRLCLFREKPYCNAGSVRDPSLIRRSSLGLVVRKTISQL